MYIFFIKKNRICNINKIYQNISTYNIMYKLVANEIETLSTHKIYSNMNIIQRERE